jgi:asparagine synthase (glutamine-hydrolysing)
LFYRSSPRRVRWASDIRPLVDDEGSVPNEGFLAEYLADRLTSTTETIYRDVFQLPPAHAMTVDVDGRHRSWRYWSPDPKRAVRYRRREEYAEEFWQTFGEAVHARLRLAGGATLSLSGGVDSAAIAAQVGQWRDRGLAAAGRVGAVTVSEPIQDESPRARTIAAACGMGFTLVPPRLSVAPHEFQADVARTRSLPEHPNSKVSDGVRAHARASGHRVVLLGLGSDQVLNGVYGTLAELIADGRFVTACQWLRNGVRTEGRHYAATQAWLAAWALVPSPLKRRLRRALGRTPVAACLDPGFARRVQFAERIRAGQARLPLQGLGSTEMFGVLSGGDHLAGINGIEALHADAGLEPRCPFYDRRVIEFALALPADVRAAGGATKAVLRQCLEPLLPQTITHAEVDIPGDWIAAASLRPLCRAATIDALLPVARGWVSSEWMRTTLARWTDRQSPQAAEVWAVMAIDFWLRGESTVRTEEGVTDGELAAG